jgi:hypothetical protein
MAQYKRKKFFVDPKVQGAFLLRIFVYWFLCIVSSGTILIAWIMLTGSNRVMLHPVAEFWAQFGPAVIVSGLMLPILMFDCVRLTNRLAGPVFRLRREMRNLVQGVPTRPIHLRPGDFFTELADDYNAIRERMLFLEERLNAKLAAPSPERAERSDDERKLSEVMEALPELIEHLT